MTEQLRCIRQVPVLERVAHFDATGGLVAIPMRYSKVFGTSYQTNLNYFLVLKHPNASTLVAELVSAYQRTERLTQFFMSLAFRFRAAFKTNLCFRLVVIDYSLASIHALLDALKRETVEMYSAHVFALAKNESGIECGLTWLASCAAHTMHRLVRSVKRKFKVSKEIKSLFCHCFSLMLNAKDLGCLDELFRAIVVVFSSPFESPVFVESLGILQLSIETRPETNTKIRDLIELVKAEQDNDDGEPEEPIKSQKLELYRQMEKSYFETLGCKSTIKEKSPFGRHFRDQLSRIELPEATGQSQNRFHCPPLIEFLMDKYMPYSFIWAGFTFQGLKYSRLTNGAVENFNGYKKGSASASNLLPHVYVQENYRPNRGSCRLFLDSFVSKPKSKP